MNRKINLPRACKQLSAMLVATMVLGPISRLQADTVFAGDIKDGWRRETVGVATGGRDRARLTSLAKARCVEAGGHKQHVEVSPLLSPRANGIIGPTVIAFGHNGSRTWGAIASGKTYPQAEREAIRILKYKKCTKWYVAKQFEAKP